MKDLSQVTAEDVNDIRHAYEFKWYRLSLICSSDNTCFMDFEFQAPDDETAKKLPEQVFNKDILETYCLKLEKFENKLKEIN